MRTRFMALFSFFPFFFSYTAFAQENNTLNSEREFRSSNYTLLAHYPLISDTADATGHFTDMTLRDTPFQDFGIYCNGGYWWADDGFEAITPDMDLNSLSSFTIIADFKITEPVGSSRPVFVCSKMIRMLGFYLDAGGTVSLFYNNSNYVLSPITYSMNVRHSAMISYDATTHMANMYLDGILAVTATIIFSTGTYLTEISPTNYGSSKAFKGIFGNLRLYDGIYPRVFEFVDEWPNQNILYLISLCD